jgi:hypothetical protein
MKNSPVVAASSSSPPSPSSSPSSSSSSSSSSSLVSLTLHGRNMALLPLAPMWAHTLLLSKQFG